MNAPTYNLRQSEHSTEAYLGAVGQLADWVVAAGGSMRSVVDAYAEFIELNGREARRSNNEYLLEALMIGVLWRARGREAHLRSDHQRNLVVELVRERRSGQAKRRDASTADLANFENSNKRGRIDPTLQEIRQLSDWMLASGEYDDELERFDGWLAFLSTTQPATNREILRLIVALAVRFEVAAERGLGPYTLGVERFLHDELAQRPKREDTLQCSRRRIEYHLNMVGAEILNRAWRRGFVACRRHVVILPACAQARHEAGCQATSRDPELRCTHCSLGCAVSSATRQAERVGAEALAVSHGSALTRLLDSDTLAGTSVGIVGIACASGLLGAGWRVRKKGFWAQCVLLNSSGCYHWMSDPVPTAFDPSELGRILDRSDADDCIKVTPRVA